MGQCTILGSRERDEILIFLKKISIAKYKTVEKVFYVTELQNNAGVVEIFYSCPRQNINDHQC